MAVSYDRLWHILIDRHWSKTKLIKEANISTNAMAKMGKGQDVRVETLVKICSVLNCTIDDIMEIIPDASTGRKNVCQQENCSRVSKEP